MAGIPAHDTPEIRGEFGELRHVPLRRVDDTGDVPAFPTLVQLRSRPWQCGRAPVYSQPVRSGPTKSFEIQFRNSPARSSFHSPGIVARFRTSGPHVRLSISPIYSMHSSFSLTRGLSAHVQALQLRPPQSRARSRCLLQKQWVHLTPEHRWWKSNSPHHVGLRLLLWHTRHIYPRRAAWAELSSMTFHVLMRNGHKGTRQG